MPKKLILSIVVLSLASFCLDEECTKKTIFSSKRIIDPDYQTKDRTLAYNKVASCTTLTPTEKPDYGVCCYIKVKFENSLNEEKYTHKGCVEVPIWYLNDNDTYDIDNFIDAMETDINTNNSYTDYKLETKSISIDCASKYLQLAGLAFLLLFL